MTNLFQYVPGNSVIHRMNPVTKIFLTIVICIAAFISGNLFYLAGLLIVDLLIGFIAGRAVAVKSLEIMSNSIRHLEYIPSAFQYAWTAISTFVFILAGHVITMRSMKKWDLVQNTRGRE